MSILVQKLKTMTQSSLPSMGFRSASAATKNAGPMLISQLSHPDVKSAKAAADSGCGAILVLSADPEVVERVTEAVRIPCGVSLEDAQGIDLNRLKKAGCDFIVFSSCSAPAAWVRYEGLGKFIKMAPAADVSSLRGIDKIGIDGLMLDREGEGDLVSVQFLMTCHFLSAIGKPLLAMAPPGLSDGDVASLWDSGVDGMVVDVSSERLKSLHKIVSGLPPRTRKKSGKDVAFLPQVQGAAEATEEEEEDE